MTSRVLCPQCKYPEVRLHAAIYHVGMQRRFWLFGAPVPAQKRVGYDASCLRCSYAFSVVNGEVIEARLQQAHDLLKQAQQHGVMPEPRLPIYDRDVMPDPRDEPARARQRARR